MKFPFGSSQLLEGHPHGQLFSQTVRAVPGIDSSLERLEDVPCAL